MELEAGKKTTVGDLIESQDCDINSDKENSSDSEKDLDQLINHMKLASDKPESSCGNCSREIRENKGFTSLYKHLVNEILKWKV